MNRASRGALRAGMLCGLGLLVAGGPQTVRAEDPLQQELIALERAVTNLALEAHAVAEDLAPHSVHRLVDAQVLAHLGDYDHAAVLLFDYVTRYREGPGIAEALFALAEAFLQRNDALSATQTFRTLLQRQQGAYRLQALQRLIEIDLQAGKLREIAGYLEALAQIPQAEQHPSVAYIRGKAAYALGENAAAIRAFAAIPPENPYALQAQYFLGAALVRAQDLAAAWDVFIALRDQPPTNEDERYMHTLAQLAVGRLLAHQGAIDQAIATYAQIPSTSSLFGTALYEMAWAHIGAARYAEALRPLETLIATQPEDPRRPELHILQGNLLVRLGRWEEATTSFEATRLRYQPLHQDLVSALAEERDPASFIAALLQDNQRALRVNLSVPDRAARWIEEQPEVQRLLRLMTALADLERDLAASQTFVTELTETLDDPQRAAPSPTTVSAPATVSANAPLRRLEDRLLQAIDGVLAAMRQHVLHLATAAQRAQLETRRDERAALMAALAARPLPADVASGANAEAGAQAAWQRDYDQMFDDEQQALTRFAVGLTEDNAQGFATLTTWADRCRDLRRALAQRRATVDDQPLSAGKRLQAQVFAEAATVADLHVALGAVRAEAAEVAEAIRNDGLSWVTRQIAESMIRADVGLLDIAWARKRATSEAVSKVLRLRDAELNALESAVEALLDEAP